MKYFVQSLFATCVWMTIQVCHLDAQSTISILTHEKHQTIDGFGAFQGGDIVNHDWWTDLYYGDLRASIYRVDLTPQLISPYSDLNVYSPWFMGSSVNSVFNLEDPDNPDGPEGNRVRTYTGPEDYSRLFGGENAPIAVMGPDIDQNISFFTYVRNDAVTEGALRKDSLGDFKLIGSIWSPLPWVKISSNNLYNQNWWPGPVINTPWPFVWGGNYAGGKLDVSDVPLAVFDDSALGGDGPTSSLTQFARSTAAYIKGFQDFHGVAFYAISIQNELNFEQFYNSATYPLSSQYIAAVNAVRAEFDKHESLRAIRIMGPEDLLGNSYGLWEYGSSNGPIHKNLQYLQHISQDPEAAAAVDFFCIHGYDTDGVSAGTANPVYWENWKHGWTESPAPGIPDVVLGYADYEKKSWMTETSGEDAQWLSPTVGFPGFGAWSVALRIHQALTAGDQSAWVYWTFLEDDEDGNATNFSLTSSTQRELAPKYVAAKHFFNTIRPGAVRVSVEPDQVNAIQSGAYLHEENNTITFVALNAGMETQTFQLNLQDDVEENLRARYFISSEGNYWHADSVSIVQGISDPVLLPAFSILSMVIQLDDESVGIAEDDITHGIQTLDIVPNPGDEMSWITMELAKNTEMNVSLLDLNGIHLKTLFQGTLERGSQKIACHADGLSGGIYLVRVSTDAGTLTSKWNVVKR